MDKLSEEFLKEYIATHSLGYDGDYNLIGFFKMFAAFDVHSFEDLLNAPNKYAEFLTKNIYLINPGSKHSREELPDMIESARLHLIRKIQLSSSKPQKDFVEIVSELSPNKKSSHILDVGAGIIPYSSILFGEKFHHASTMDKRFYLTPDTLENMNVTPYDQFFDASTPVDKFDIVVGKAPCSAIEHIVRNCAAAGKPYFIELCDCHLPNKKTYIADWSGWQDILPDIDQYVQFYTAESTFAFNLGDTNASQVKRVIDKYIPPRVFQNITPKVSTSTHYASRGSWIRDTTEPPRESSFSDDLMMELFERS